MASKRIYIKRKISASEGNIDWAITHLMEVGEAFAASDHVEILANILQILELLDAMKQMIRKLEQSI